MLLFMGICSYSQKKDLCNGKTKKECVQLMVNNYLIKRIDSEEARCGGKEVNPSIKSQYMKLRGRKCLKTGTYRSFVMFNVNEKGIITNIITKSQYKHISREIENVLLKLPNLDPIYENGKPVSFKFGLPVVLKYR